MPTRVDSAPIVLARKTMETMKVNGATTGRLSSQNILAQMTLKDKVFLLSGTSFTRTSGLPQHSLHPAKTSDGPTDIRGDSVFNAPPSMVLPNATCLASSWDTDLIESVGRVLAGEAKLKSVDVLLAPTLNLHRDPRGGRNQESYGEDPLLAGKCGAAFVRGVQSQGIATCAKHLVCNDSEIERRFYDVQVDERTLREVYLRPFEIVVEEANPRAIMTSYNKINGTSAAQNSHIMGIVRDEWEYKGLFMSDWFGTYDGVVSVKAGLDLEMPFPSARGPHLLQAIERGDLTEAELDPLCNRMIDFLRDLNSPDEVVRGGDLPSAKLPQDAKLIRQAAAEGMILLKNENEILPLDPTTTQAIAVIGSLATDRVLTQLICPSYLVTPLQGITSSLIKQTPLHAHGLQTHKVVPKLDFRYCDSIEFRKWNVGDRTSGRGRPVQIDRYSEALEAMLLRQIPGLDPVFEIEMVATIRVPKSGRYVLSVIACHDAKVFIDGQPVFSYSPGGLVDIQRFLFHFHEVAQTLTYRFEAKRSYDICIVAKSQPQSGPEPVAQGLIFGMVEEITREESIAEAVEVAKKAATVVLFVGTTNEWEMEGVDRADIRLPCDQDEMIQAVLDANPRTIVVNQSGSAVDLTTAQGAAAILHAHFSGQEAGNAIADVLFGKVNPSAKATYTWPRSISDMPTHGNFPCSKDLSLKYSEGIEGGYRGYLRAGTPVAYPFGYGLSYTSFAYENSRIEHGSTDSINLITRVRNTGRVSGREVVQVYVSGPSQSSRVRPIRTLEGFAKTSLLQPGQVQVLSVLLTKRAFSAWDQEERAWSNEKGEYSIQLATSAEDVIQSFVHLVEQNSH